MDRVPDIVLDRPVDGTGLSRPRDHQSERAATLRDQLAADRPTLLVFLRHLGCSFCREMIKDVRAASDRADGTASASGEHRFPHVVFFHMGSAAQGARLFGRYWPGAPAVADPHRHFYHAFEVPRGTIGQLIGPRAFACAMRSLMKGHGIGRPVGDKWTLPVVLLVAPDGHVLFRHAPGHAGDHPDFDRFAGTQLPPDNASRGGEPGDSHAADSFPSEPAATATDTAGAAR